jgi:hypothetical protein
MKQLNVNILGISEIKWKDEGYLRVKITEFWINVNQRMGQRVKNYLLHNDRIVLIKRHLSTTYEAPIHMDRARGYSTIPNRLHHDKKET